MTRKEFKERLWELEERSATTFEEDVEDAADLAEEAGVVWDEKADQDRRFVQVTTSAEAAEILREFNRRREEVEGAGVQAPEPKRLTERLLRELAADAGLRAAEMGQAAQALGFKIVPDEVELPARIRIVVAGAADGETGRLLTDPERRAAEAWWEQRLTLVIIA